MERVTGIGGVFLHAADPERLGRWYADRLGVEAVPGSREPPWSRPPGIAVFPAADATTDEVTGPAGGWSVRFRVDDLDAMLARLRDAGVDVAMDDTRSANARFASLHDPEGNLVQLWQPDRAAVQAAPAGPSSYVHAVDVGPHEAPAPDSRDRRRGWARWLPLLLVVVVGAVVVTTLGREAEPELPSAPSPAPTPATTAGRGESTAPANPVVVREVGRPLLDAGGDLELFALGSGELVRIQLARGRVTRTSLPPLRSSGPVSFIVGPDRALIRPLDAVPGYVVADGQPARRLPGELGHGGHAFPGPRPGRVWLQTENTGPRIPMALFTLDGRRTGPSLPTGANDFWPLGPDKRGYVLGGATGGAYVARPDGLHRVTTGAVQAVGPTRFLTKECDRRARCSSVVINRDTGSRRVLAENIKAETGPLGTISPDGSVAAVFPGGPIGVHTVHLVDLDSGATRPLDVPIDPNLNNDQNLAWSPDSRWLFADGAGKLIAIDVRTRRAHEFDIDLPTINQVAVRP